MQEGTSGRIPEPTTYEVLHRLADLVGQEAPGPEKVSIEQATPWIYAGRVYRGGLGEFEGFEIRFERQPQTPE